MLDALETARKLSEIIKVPVYAYSNGNQIIYFDEHEKTSYGEYLTEKGYWICSIFEHGHRVEA